MAIGMVALLATLLWFGIKHMAPKESATPADGVGSANAAAVDSSDDELLLDLPAEIVIKQQLAPGEVAVYECVQDGHTTISDRPCGPGAIGRIIDTRQLNTYSQAPVAPVDMKRHRQPPVSGAGPRIATPQTAQSARAARCKSIQDEIDSINARMRQPYRKEEGEWLRRRWHSAKELYYDEDCGKLDLPAP